MDMIVDQAVEAVAAKGAKQKRGTKRIGGKKVNVKGVRLYVTNQGDRFVARAMVGGKPVTKGGFVDRKTASAWKGAQEQTKVERAAIQVPESMTMSQLFAEYERLSEEKGKPLPDAQVLMFKRLSRHPMLVNVRVSEIGAAVVHSYCSARKNVDGVSPATILSEYVRINVSIRRVSRWLQWDKFNPLGGAREGLVEDGLIAESNERDRRPSAQELVDLRAYFSSADYCERMKAGIPMIDVVEVAVQNGLRRGEIMDIRWSDLTPAGIWVWRKDSTQKTGERPGKRRCLVPLIGNVREIIERQPRIDGEDRIFPFSPVTVSSHFAQACDVLGINTEDTPDSQALCFHDLRHEAISTFAQFVETADAKMISGHKSDRSFNRYVNHKEEDAVRIAAKVTAGLMAMRA